MPGDNSWQSCQVRKKHQIYSPHKWLLSVIKQENEEITKIDWWIDSYKIYRKYIAAEFPPIVSLLRLNW